MSGSSRRQYKLMVQDFTGDVYQEYLFDMTISDVDSLNLLDGALSDAERAAYDRLAQLDVCRTWSSQSSHSCGQGRRSECRLRG